MARDNVLIVIDMQNDFVSGSLATPGAKEIIPRIIERLEEHTKYYYPVVFTRDTHYLNYLNTHEGKYLPIPHCLENTPGWCIVDELYKYSENAYEVINKMAFGYKCWKDYFERKNIDPKDIFICGLVTDICVISNALILRALYPDIEITVYSDCCAGTTKEMHEKALDVMRSCQINVV